VVQTAVRIGDEAEACVVCSGHFVRLVHDVATQEGEGEGEGGGEGVGGEEGSVGYFLVLQLLLASGMLEHCQ
jgi:hypothetical protein